MTDTMRARDYTSSAPTFGYASAPAGVAFTNPWDQQQQQQHIMAQSSMPQDTSSIPSMARNVMQQQQQQRNNSLSSPFNSMPLASSRPSSLQPTFSSEMYQTQPTNSNNTNTSNNNNTSSGLISYSYKPEPNTSAAAIPTSAGYGGVGGYGPYGQNQGRDNSLYGLQPSYNNNTDRRLSHPGMSSSSSYFDSPVASRPRQNSLIEYPPRAHASNYTALNGRDGSVAGSVAAVGLLDMHNGGGGGGHRNSSVASSYYPASTASSISSSVGSYPSYGNNHHFGSMDSTNTDVSSVDGYDSRVQLPRPNGMLVGHGLGGPQSGAQSMMSTFSSRVSSSTAKKHKCKICDKRFTRPSSLQTHMYSHTGEKPFACDVEGCGRQFSVVSNLRRHRKVHKGLPDMDSASNGSPETM